MYEEGKARGIRYRRLSEDGGSEIPWRKQHECAQHHGAHKRETRVDEKSTKRETKHALVQDAKRPPEVEDYAHLNSTWRKMPLFTVEGAGNARKRRMEEEARKRQRGDLKRMSVKSPKGDERMN